MKRIISALLVITLLLTALAFTSVESVAADGIAVRINALRSKFPNGKYWNHYTNANHNHNGAYGSCTNGSCNNPDGYTSSPCSSHQSTVGVGGIDCNNFDGAIQCMGFAYKLFYDVFGVYATQTANRYDKANVTVGDYVRILGDTHSALVIGRNGDTITVAECNLDGSGASYNCYIRWDKTYSVSSISYFKHASNYDAVKANGNKYPGKPTLSVVSGSTADEVFLHSSKAENTTWYDYRIFRAGDTANAITTLYNQPIVTTLSLPAGEYYASVTGVNGDLVNTDRWWGEPSNLVYFTVGSGSLKPVSTVKYNGNTYELYLNKLTWEHAKAKCEELGGHLVTITSAAEQNALNALASDYYVYTGGYEEKGSWKWVTGEDMSYTKWGENQPDNYTGWADYTAEDYIAVSANGVWNDAANINYYVGGFICEYEGVNVSKFTDVKSSHWFYDAVSFVTEKGYMKGMSTTKFSPNSNITREQFVLILANIAGVNTDQFKNTASKFSDVKTGQWYSGAVTWAANAGYISGISETKFGCGQSIQRAALARMLFNYASKNGISTSGRADLSSFGDATEFVKPGNAWMVEPVQWAVKVGIISGMNIDGKNCVNPKGTATRAQAARMLMQFDSLMK